MEILTLLKANIRRKKGAFISIMLLTAIVVTVITMAFSVRKNYYTGIEDAIEYADCGEVNVYIRTDQLTEELCSLIENSALTDSVNYYKGLVTNGTTIGEYYDGNCYVLMELTDGIRLFSSDEKTIVDEIPELESGEIYLPLGLKYKLRCGIGDTVIMDLLCGEYSEFTIKGFVQEPMTGSMMIGLKNVFISHEDFEKIYEHFKPMENETAYIDITRISIHSSDDSYTSSRKYQGELNFETKIVDYSAISVNKDEWIHYTTLLPDILLGVVLAFSVILFIVVLIIMSHSIGIEIEIDYTTLGVLKSQGFTKGKIRAIIMLQYILAEVLGIIVGCFAAIPIERVISGIFKYVTAVFPESGMCIGKNLLFIAVIIVVSAAIIFIKTRKVAKISPIRAISGGTEEIFFDSRLNMPITKKFLSASLSLRQFTSAKKRYFGTVFITAVFTFCMVSINLVGNMISSRYALDAMGMTIADLNVSWFNSERADASEIIDEIISSYTEIKQKNSLISTYISLNGENLCCLVYEYPEYIGGVLKGRTPIYDNEIMITEMAADELELQMGDEVILASQGEEGRFIISGIFQSMSDAGRAFAMSSGGAEKLGIDCDTYYRYYVLADPSVTDSIVREIENTFGDEVEVTVYDEDLAEMDLYDMIVLALKIIIYTFSVIFTFVVIEMVCSKAFVQERTNIGIYKSIGFTSCRLRLEFAIRFLIVSVIGAAFGIILSVFLSEKILCLIFQMLGLSKITLEYTAVSILIPVGAICLSCFIFAYFASYKVKYVAVRELIME